MADDEPGMLRRALRRVWRRLTVPGPEDELLDKLPGADGMPTVRGWLDSRVRRPRRPRSTVWSDDFEKSQNDGRFL